MTQDERWDKFYNVLINYYKKNGNIRVPRKFIIDGIKLGFWLYRQSVFYNEGKLPQERIDKLNELGMVWKHYKQNCFDHYYNLLKKYYEEFGNIDIPYNYEIDGVKLGSWICRLRHSYKIDNNQNLTQAEIDKLNKLGIKWEIRNIYSFDYYYSLLMDYYKDYGNINVPKDYIINGVMLGRWINNQREAYRHRDKKTHTITHVITQDEIDKLNELGMVWRFFYSDWTKNYNLAVEYYEKNGNINIPYDYVIDDIDLGYWLNIQRELYNEKSPKLLKGRILKLNKLGIDWNIENTKILNGSIDNFELYNSILNERVNFVLRDLTIEGKSKIFYGNKQKQLKNELVKRIWR